MASVSYTADNTTNFPNPERGFFYFMGTDDALDATFFTSQNASQARSFYKLLYNLNGYENTSTIDATKITELTDRLGRMRSAGAKCTLRAVYDYAGDGSDASLGVVLAHITQLKPIISANADVVPIWEMGFVGAYGELWGSAFYGNINGTTYDAGLTNDQWSAREAILTAMLSAAPADTFITMRYPWMKMHKYGTTATTAAQGFDQSHKSRVGHYNDYFVSNQKDGNTYLFSATDRAYTAADTFYVPNGGESGALDTTYGACSPAQSDLNRMHISFLNIAYHPDVINTWSASGCLSTVKLNLGYRFQLVSSTYATTATIGSSLNVNIHLQNLGYASPFGRRTAYYVMRNASQSHAYALASDPRLWFTGSVSVAEAISLSTMPAGTYDCYLWLPDRHPTLSNRPAYSIRFANNNVWDATEGFNNLNQSIAVVSAEEAGTPDVPAPFFNRKLRRVFG
jgi:hypothetical protein